MSVETYWTYKSLAVIFLCGSYTVMLWQQCIVTIRSHSLWSVKHLLQHLYDLFDRFLFRALLWSLSSQRTIKPERYMQYLHAVHYGHIVFFVLCSKRSWVHLLYWFSDSCCWLCCPLWRSYSRGCKVGTEPDKIIVAGSLFMSLLLFISCLSIHSLVCPRRPF